MFVRHVPVQPLRILVGLLGTFFAYALGRALVRLHRRKQPFTKALTWILRTVVCLFAVMYTGGFDATGIAVPAAAALGLLGGAYLEWRPRHVEEVHLFRE